MQNRKLRCYALLYCARRSCIGIFILIRECALFDNVVCGDLVEVGLDFAVILLEIPRFHEPLELKLQPAQTPKSDSS